MLTEIRGELLTEAVGGVSPANALDGSTVPYASPASWATIRPYQCVVGDDLENLEFVTDFIDVRNLWNLTPPADQPSVAMTYNGSSPTNQLDWTTFGRLHNQDTLHNIAKFFTGRWNEFGDYAAPIKGQNPVYHPTLFGDVKTGETDARFLRPFVEGVENELPYRAVAISGNMPYVLTPAGDTFAMPNGLYRPTCAAVIAAVNNGHYTVLSPSLAINKLYRRGRIRQTPNWYEVEYEYIVHKTETDGTIYLNHFVISQSIQVSTNPHESDLHSLQPVSDIVTMEHKVTWYVVRNMWGEAGHDLNMSIAEYLASSYYIEPPDVFSNWEELCVGRGNTITTNMDVALATATVSKTLDQVIGYDLALGRFRDTYPGTFKYFERVASLALREATPLTFLASKDAIEEHFAYFESNHIEAIAEISEILAPVDVLKLMRALPSKALSGKTVVMLALFNILADATLTYNLGIAPTVSDAEDISLNARNFQTRILSGEVFKANTLHGKFSCAVPPELIGGLEGAVAIVRSTVRMKPMLDSLLPALLPFKALGLLPSFSTLWDLFPGSFILDWWTDTGTALDIVDNSMLMLAMETDYCVHSIKIVHNIPDCDLREVGASSLNADGAEPGYSLYLRYVSRSLPTFGPTRYPVISSGISSYSTAGALTYKILT